MFYKKCEYCSTIMVRKKKSEAERANWLFCSRKCHAINANKKRKTDLRRNVTCPNCNSKFITEVKKQIYCSLSCSLSYRNKHNNPAKTPEGKSKISKYAKLRGTTHLRTKSAIDKLKKTISGEGHWNWKGGLTNINKIYRNRIDFRNWVKSILKRDDYTCKLCGVRGGRLEVDHIKPFAFYPELRMSDSNARTLCIDCHKKTDTYMGRAYKYKKLKVDL